MNKKGNFQILNRNKIIGFVVMFMGHSVYKCKRTRAESIFQKVGYESSDTRSVF